jgi:hypothetical protein
MEHEQATATLAAERYILNELTAAEREAFEEHYFVCERCAQEVKDLFALGVAAKEVLPVRRAESATLKEGQTSRWRHYFGAWTLPRFALAVPCALLIAAIVTGWQIVRMRRLMEPRSIASLVLRPETRGDTAAINLQRLGPYLLLECDLPGAGGKVNWALSQSTKILHRGEAAVPDAGVSFKLLLPSSSLSPGDYSLNVRSAAGAPANATSRSWTYRFKIN